MRAHLALLWLLAASSVAAQWEHTGPYGALTSCHLHVYGHERVGGVAGIFKSTDGTSTWFPIGTGLPAGGIQALHHDGSVLTAPGSSDWQEITDDLQADEPLSLSAGGGFLFAATDGRSVARRPLFTVGQEEAHRHPRFVVAPNPAQDHTRFLGAISAGTPIIIRDAAGREMQRLRAHGGAHQDLDVSRLEAGLYTLAVEDAALTFTSRFTKP